MALRKRHRLVIRRRPSVRMMAKFTSHVTTSGHSLTGPVTTGCRQSRTSREPVGDEHGVPVASGFKIALSMSLQLSVDIRYVGLKNYFTARTKASRATYLRIFRYRTTALHAKLRSTVFSEGRLILTRSLFDPGRSGIGKSAAITARGFQRRHRLQAAAFQTLAQGQAPGK
jgi:hypothetical protein